MSATFPPWTIGIAGHGVSAPALIRMRPDLCAEHGHPGVTYNPWHDKTWCLCGEVVVNGNHDTWADKCGGPLIEYLTEQEREYWATFRAEQAKTIDPVYYPKQLGLWEWQ